MQAATLRPNILSHKHSPPILFICPVLPTLHAPLTGVACIIGSTGYFLTSSLHFRYALGKNYYAGVKLFSLALTNISRLVSMLLFIYLWWVCNGHHIGSSFAGAQFMMYHAYVAFDKLN
jgi:hypothetical protein